MRREFSRSRTTLEARRDSRNATTAVRRYQVATGCADIVGRDGPRCDCHLTSQESPPALPGAPRAASSRKGDRARIARLARTVAIVRDSLPEVPLMLGGGGRRMLSLAAQQADIVSIVAENASGVAPTLGDAATLERSRERVDWVRAEAGSRFDALELHMRVYGAADESQASEISPSDAAASPFLLVRPARAMADKLLRLRDELGFSYFTLSERFTDEFAPVIAMLADA